MKILVDGQMIEYKNEGTGRVVVFLHGWGTNLKTFDEMSDMLKKGFQVIRLDFPGFGSSPKPADDWDVGRYARLVGQLIDKLNIDVYAVIGHSFGGRVIIKGIADNHFDTDKIVLIGAAGVKPKGSARRGVYKTIAKVGKSITALPGLRQLRPALRKKLYSSAGSMDYLESQQMQKIFLNTINEDLLPYIHLLVQPSLLIWGENDSETPVADAYKMMNELPHAELVVIPDAGHFVYTDDASAVAKELEVFLK